MKSQLYKVFATLMVVVFLATACAPAGTPAAESQPAATLAAVLPATAVPEATKSADVQPTEAPEVKQGGTVNLAISNAPDTFIPQYTLGAYSRFLDSLLFVRLLRYNEDTSLMPWLAESYDVSDDGTVFTFHLRSDAKWHDGEPITAEDVAWTYNFMLHKDYAGTRQLEAPIVGIEDYRAGKTDSVSGIKVLDPQTVQITLTEPNAPFLELVAQQVWILPKHVMQDTPVAEMDKHWMSQTPTVGSGPIKFVKYETDQYVEFVRNEDYFLGAPNIEKFIFKIVKADVALAQFEKGELDATTKVGTMSSDQIEKLQTLDVSVVPVAGTAVQVLAINNSREYFKDKRVRQAIAHAIDRKAMIDALLDGYALMQNASIPEFSPYFNPETKDMLEYNPEKARALLEEAGWDFNREIVLNFPTGNVTRERSAPIIQQYLNAVGMKVKLESSDFTAMRQRIDKNELDLWLVGSSYVVFDPDVKSIFHTDSMPPNGWNSWMFSNPEADRLIMEGLRNVDPEKRKPIYMELQKVIAEEVPIVYLYYPMEINVVANRLKNANPVPVGMEWNIHEWYLDE